MLSVYVADGARLEKRVLAAQDPMPANPVWIDLLARTLEEDVAVERVLNSYVPTRDEMQEIGG